MKLFTKIILISILLFFFIESSNAVLLPRFESYKKKFLEHKVYVINDHGSEYEIKGADYGSFKYWDSYAHDKNSIYIAGDIVQKRINLDKSFNNFYEDVIYTKDNKVYYKNKYNDLIEITTKGDNLKVIYNTEGFIGIVNNDLFFNLDVSQWGFYNDNRRLDIKSGCSIATLEYENGIYFDGKNICGYAYPVNKKLIEELNNKIIKKLDNLSRWELIDIHNTIYEKRNELYDSTFRTNSTNQFDRYLLVSMEHILQYINCGNYGENENYIGCISLHRRQLLYP